MKQSFSFTAEGTVISVARNFHKSGQLKDSVQLIGGSPTGHVVARTNRGLELQSFIGQYVSLPACIYPSGEGSLMLVITDLGRIEPAEETSKHAV